MSRRAQWILLALLLGATAAGFASLFRLRLARGDVFPAYSSLRADPLGAKALHDSLEQLPGLRVTRRYQPLDRIAPTPPRTIVLAGLTVEEWLDFPTDSFVALDAAVRGGSRLVIAFRAEEEPESKKPPEKNRPANRPSGSTPPAKQKRDPREVARGASSVTDWARLWGVTVEQRDRVGDVMRAPLAPADFPEALRSESDLYFRPTTGTPWRVLYRRIARPVLIELAHGRGSIVLAGDSYWLSNEALQRERSAPLLAWLVGQHPRVEFDESHLGVVQKSGVAALARRYGLTGAFFMFVLFAMLFIWRRLAYFVPPPAEVPELALSYNQTAALEALLRRAVPPGEVMAACTAEWRRTARPADLTRLENALAACPAKAAPASIYNAAVQALRRR